MGTDTAEEPVDGRRARRERNQDAVVDAVVRMFREEALVPSIEDAARRSGLSLRSVYRYFEDADALLQAAIARSLEQAEPQARIAAIGEGPLDERIARFVAARMRVYEYSAPGFRATVHSAVRSSRIRDALEDVRRRLREQVELQFAPELTAMPKAEREQALAAADVLTQLDSVDLLRRHRGFSVAATTAILERGLGALLGDPGA